MPTLRDKQILIYVLYLSKLGLIEHTKRARLQGGWLWRECLYNVLLPDPTRWGWKESGEWLIPCCQQCGDYIQVNNIIQTCTCKINGCKSCKCSKQNMNCLPFCSCEGQCHNC